MKEVFALIRKDYIVDWRLRYPLAGLIFYIVATVYISYLSFNNVITSSVWNALFWIILLFSSITALAKSFIQEENRSLYYYFLTTPTKIILAKLIYYLIFQYLIAIITLLVFILFLQNPIGNIQLFLLNLIIGVTGIAASLTLVSSLSAKTGNNSTLMSVLGFPIIIPILLLAVTNSRKIVLGANWDTISGNSITMISIDIVIIALLFMLFPYSWKN